jgi:hypothetical protein
VLRLISMGAGTLLKIAAKKDHLATQLFRFEAALCSHMACNCTQVIASVAAQRCLLTRTLCVLSDNSGSLGATSIDGNCSMTLTKCNLTRNKAVLDSGRGALEAVW